MDHRLKNAYHKKNLPPITRPTLINLNSDERNQGLPHYAVMTSLDKNNRNWNTTEDLPITIFFPNKTEDLNSNVFKNTSGIH